MQLFNRFQYRPSQVGALIALCFGLVIAATALAQEAPLFDPAAPVTPATQPAVKPVEGGQIIARIDGQIVLASDVLWQVEKLIDANRDRIPPAQIDVARETLLRQQVNGLIDTKILYADFRRKVPAENLPNIEENLQEPFEEREIPRLIEMFELNDKQELNQMLSEAGTSLKDLQRQFIERTIASEWLRQMLPKPSEATHEEMLEYYRAHLEDYDYPAQATWEELMISFKQVDDDRAKAWQQITALGNEVWQRVQQQPNLRGAVFAELAKEKSHGFTAQDGGLHDWTTKGAMRSEELNDALFKLKVGQLSNVIETELGFHIVRVLDRKEAGRTPFTEVQQDIRAQLKQEQQRGAAAEQMAKLRTRSRVWTMFDGDLSGTALNERMQSSARK